MTTPPTPTRHAYYDDSERVSFTPRVSSLQRLLWAASHGLLGVSLIALRPGWLGSAAILAIVLGHAWRHRPRPVYPFVLGPEGQVRLPPPAVGEYGVQQAEVGPWHVYLVLKGAGPIVRLCIYKDALQPAAWAALRRRLLVGTRIGSLRRRC